MAQFVPASTPVKFKRVHNVDADRLMRRLAFLRTNRAQLAKADHLEVVRNLARETHAIHADLTARGAFTAMFAQLAAAA